jgi:CheY-like chemotaxis protein
MNVLIIEDNNNNRNKIKSFLESKDVHNITEAFSYSSGVRLAEAYKYDYIILDMSMPTYDITEEEGGGQFRVFGGKDILKRLQRKNKMQPFILVTQYSTFSEIRNTKTFDQIEVELSSLYSPYFKKAIYYDTASSSWKEELNEVIQTS